MIDVTIAMTAVLFQNPGSPGPLRIALANTRTMRCIAVP